MYVAVHNDREAVRLASTRNGPSIPKSSQETASSWQNKLRSWTENVFPDRYARNARLYPSLLVIAPIVIAIVAIAKIELSGLKTLWVGLGAVGGTYWLSQLARDPGKNLEKKLWDSWGGTPSITILRHCDPRIDAITKARYHGRLVELVANTTAPSARC